MGPRAHGALSRALVPDMGAACAETTQRENKIMYEHFYVSIIDGDRKSLALGPFAVHADAIANVDKVRDFLCGPDGAGQGGRAWFWEYGTARVKLPISECPAGKLNGQLNFI